MSKSGHLALSMPAGTGICWRLSCKGSSTSSFEIKLIGFSAAEIDVVFDEARESSPDGPPNRRTRSASLSTIWHLRSRDPATCGVSAGIA
jgi:hypothetical protein